MAKENKQFYLVDFEILPEAIKKAIQAKELLKEGQCTTVNEAVQKVKISRSAYYKYRNHVLPGAEIQKERVVVLLILMVNELSLMNRLMKRFLFGRNEILGVFRGVPTKHAVVVTVSVKSSESKTDWDTCIDMSLKIKGVKSIHLTEQGGI